MERQARGWSYKTLADEMTRAGCSIAPASVYKVEKGDPPRRITVDELLALAQVFELEVTDLLTPIELIRADRARELVRRIEEAESALGGTAATLVNAYSELLYLSACDPEVAEAVNNMHRASSASDAAHGLIPALQAFRKGLAVDPSAVEVSSGSVASGVMVLMASILETATAIGRAMFGLDEESD